MKKITFYLLIIPFLSFSQSVTNEKKAEQKQITSDKVTLSVKDSVLTKTENINADEKPKSEYSIIWNPNYKQHRYASFNNVVNILYNYDKLKINSSITYGREQNYWENDVNTFYPDVSFIGKSTTDFDFNSLITFIDVEYQIFKRTKINVSSYNDKYENIFKTNNYIDMLSTTASTLDKNYIGNRLLNSTLQRNSFNFLLRHDFNENNKYLTFEGDWIQRLGNYYQNTYGQDYDNTATPVPDRSYVVFHEGNFDIDVYSVNSKLNLPLKWFDFSIGAKWVYIELDYDINFFRKYNVNYEQDLFLSPICKYIENRQSLFMDFKKKVKNWEFEYGLKLENTLIDGYVSRINTEALDNNYLRPLSSVKAAYNFDEKNKLTFSYSNSFKRPPFRFINPSIGIYHAYENYNGNPYLSPAKLNNFNLSYNYNAKYNVTFTYLNTKDSFNALTAFTSDHISTHKVFNYMDLDLFQISGTATLKPVKFLDTNVQLDGFYKSHKSQVSVIDDIDTFGWYGMIKNQITISKTISSSLNFWYRSRNLDQEILSRRQGSLDFGVKYLSLNQNFSIGLNVTDILKSMEENKLATVNNINQQFRNYWEPRTLKVAATYKFGNKKLNYVERVAENVTDQTR